MPTDLAMMHRALELAVRGWGRVHPNPLVGAVIARGHEVIGEGWHAEFGGLHAERVALDAAGSGANGATLYTTLEPCTHTGKQPPCVDAIVAAGIARVVVGIADPNPLAGGGAARLRESGVAVDEGILATEAARQNFRFLHRFGRSARPFVAIKLAVSLDGMVADASGASRWVSGPEARTWVHALRAGFGGVAVGGKTAVQDDVRLTVRGQLQPRVPPVRIIFDRDGRMTPAHGIFAAVADAPVVLIVGTKVTAEHRTDLERAGAQIIVADQLDLALTSVAATGVDALLVEGGGRLAGALLREKLVDRIYQVQCPVWLGHGVPAWDGLDDVAIATARRWQLIERQSLGGDTLMVLEP